MLTNAVLKALTGNAAFPNQTPSLDVASVRLSVGFGFRVEHGSDGGRHALLPRSCARNRALRGHAGPITQLR